MLATTIDIVVIRQRRDTEFDTLGIAEIGGLAGIGGDHRAFAFVESGAGLVTRPK
jgi:hypothetical protein